MLGGTTEASQLAQHLATHWADPQAGRQVVFSYAGRTARPASQPVPVRIGGFGGVAGLADYIISKGVTHVVDATHPFAAQMSTNAIAACQSTQVPLCALQRPQWIETVGDKWQHFTDVVGAVHALPDNPARIFLAIGKQNLVAFAAKPYHHYLLRLVDQPAAQLPLPNVSVVINRGPFDVAQDIALLQEHAITHIVAKNAGGAGAEAKIHAARALNLPILMIDRPALAQRVVLGTVAEVMRWMQHAD